jgi:hypothetical protein
MVTKFKIFLERAETGIVNIRLDDNDMIFNFDVKNTEKGTRAFLMYDESPYAELSVIVPDTENLDKSEFFLNPEVDKRIVDELVKQNFIQKGDRTTTAGDVQTVSYFIC